MPTLRPSWRVLQPLARHRFDLHLFEDLSQGLLQGIPSFVEWDARHHTFDPIAESAYVMPTCKRHLNSGLIHLDVFETLCNKQVVVLLGIELDPTCVLSALRSGVIPWSRLSVLTDRIIHFPVELARVGRVRTVVERCVECEDAAWAQNDP